MQNNAKYAQKHFFQSVKQNKNRNILQKYFNFSVQQTGKRKAINFFLQIELWYFGFLKNAMQMNKDCKS